MRKILMLLLTAAMCLTACGKDAPLPELKELEYGEKPENHGK